MTTCRELAAAIVEAKDEATKSKLEEQLAAREKAVRDGLKAREKALRGKENASLKEVAVLLAECEKELPDNDSILKRLRASLFSKESHIQETYDAKLTKKNSTCRTLEGVLKACEADLGGHSSPQTKELLSRIKKMLQTRRASHRAPLEMEVSQCRSLTLKELAKLKAKLFLELDDTDSLLSEVKEAEDVRESTVKVQLTSRFKEIIKDLKKTKGSVISAFLDECVKELDENDALLAQVKSTLETKLMETKGLKHVHNLDELERGERERVTDDLPVSRSKKSKADSSSKKKSSKSAAKSGPSMAGSIISSAVEVVQGFKSDLSGSPPASTTYKLGVIVVFVMYVMIVFYSTSLMFKVTNFELDVSSLTAKLPQMPTFRHASSAGAGAKVSPTNAKKAAPPTPAATQAAEPEEASAGGGGDDDDD